MTFKKPNLELANLIRSALDLLPEGELLALVEATNNVCLSHHITGPTYPEWGAMEVIVTTYTKRGHERTYQMLGGRLHPTGNKAPKPDCDHPKGYVFQTWVHTGGAVLECSKCGAIVSGEGAADKCDGECVLRGNGKHCHVCLLPPAQGEE